VVSPDAASTWQRIRVLWYSYIVHLEQRAASLHLRLHESRRRHFEESLCKEVFSEALTVKEKQTLKQDQQVHEKISEMLNTLDCTVLKLT
jgi:hypothetical protein